MVVCVFVFCVSFGSSTRGLSTTVRTVYARSPPKPSAASRSSARHPVSPPVLNQVSSWSTQPTHLTPAAHCSPAVSVPPSSSYWVHMGDAGGTENTVGGTENAVGGGLLKKTLCKPQSYSLYSARLQCTNHSPAPDSNLKPHLWSWEAGGLTRRLKPTGATIYRRHVS